MNIAFYIGIGVIAATLDLHFHIKDPILFFDLGILAGVFLVALREHD